MSFGSTTPVSISGTNPGTATLTISTTATSNAALFRSRRLGVRWCAVGSTTLACILLFGIPARRSGWRSKLTMLALFVILGGNVLACGGGSGGGGGNSGGSGGTGNPGTTAGTYTVTVTGTSGTTTATGTLALTVQ